MNQPSTIMHILALKVGQVYLSIQFDHVAVSFPWAICSDCFQEEFVLQIVTDFAQIYQVFEFIVCTFVFV